MVQAVEVRHHGRGRGAQAAGQVLVAAGQHGSVVRVEVGAEHLVGARGPVVGQALLRVVDSSSEITTAARTESESFTPVIEEPIFKRTWSIPLEPVSFAPISSSLTVPAILNDGKSPSTKAFSSIVILKVGFVESTR